MYRLLKQPSDFLKTQKEKKCLGVPHPSYDLAVQMQQYDYYNIDTFVFVIKLTELTVITFVSIGPGAMALNLIPYFPHSAASDLKKNINLKCHVQQQKKRTPDRRFVSLG